LTIADCRWAKSKVAALKSPIKKSAIRNLQSAILVLAAILAAAPLYAAGLTNPEPLAKAYDLILDARPDEAEQQLRTACGPAPPTGCLVLRAVSAYWQLLSDPDDTSHDAAVLAKADAAIASAEAWAAREPKRAEAWFYVGGAYGTRVLMRGMVRDEMFAAARDGKRIYDALRQAVALDSSLQDAYFGLGLYHYYAAVAPTVARVLRVLLLLPAGDRAGGLREMQQTQSRGLLLRGEADYQLQLIYHWYEGQPATALRLVEGLRTRYPHNPLFALRAAVLQNDAFHNTQASLDIYRSLLEAARAGRVAYPGLSEINARLGMAQELDLLCDSGRAIEQLRLVIAAAPAAPYSAMARAHYQLGAALDHAGRRSDALVEYRRALATIPSDDRLQLGSKARDAMKRPAIGRICR
jgi:tetratricopeptide (TPR) repeat protein